MPEERVPYPEWFNTTADGPMPEPELICPLRQMALDGQGCGPLSVVFEPVCLKDKCAWWNPTLDIHMCSIAVIRYTLCTV